MQHASPEYTSTRSRTTSSHTYPDDTHVRVCLITHVDAPSPGLRTYTRTQHKQRHKQARTHMSYHHTRTEYLDLTSPLLVYDTYNRSCVTGTVVGSDLSTFGLLRPHRVTNVPCPYESFRGTVRRSRRGDTRGKDGDRVRGTYLVFLRSLLDWSKCRHLPCDQNDPAGRQTPTVPPTLGKFPPADRRVGWVHLPN